MSKLRLMQTGHGDKELVTWSSDDAVGIMEARQVFSRHLEMGHMAFRLFPDRPGTSEIIKELIGDEDEVLLVPPIQGG